MGWAAAWTTSSRPSTRTPSRPTAPTTARRVVFHVDAEPGKPFRSTSTSRTTRRAPTRRRSSRLRASRTLDRAVRQGFDATARRPARYMDDFWHRSDIQVSRAAPRALQQCLRWNLFQLLQATGRVENAGVPAKGLTGQAYEGHYFWDMEIYVMPFLIYTAPRLARNLLNFRHGMLDKARERARDLEPEGRAVPLADDQRRGGRRYYAAGTAQYHINAAIAYALKKYVDVTGDQEFLREYGAEMLVETARLWYDLGFFSDRHGRQVLHPQRDRARRVHHRRQQQHLHQPDGPREPLVRRRRRSNRSASEHPQHYAALAHRTKLDPAEAAEWRRAADNMYVPYDERTQINPQDDSFLDREVVGHQEHAEGQVPAAAPLPPAGDLPLPGDQAGRHRAGDVPARQRVLAGAEEAQLRLLRPAHDRRLVPVGVHPEHRRRRDRLRRRRPSSTSATPC